MTKITYELKKSAVSGVNWITLPSTNPPITNANAMIKSIPNIVDGNNVGWWNSTSQLPESYTKQFFGYTGINFPVKPARGYSVSISADTAWTPP